MIRIALADIDQGHEVVATVWLPAVPRKGDRVVEPDGTEWAVGGAVFRPSAHPAGPCTVELWVGRQR